MWTIRGQLSDCAFRAADAGSSREAPTEKAGTPERARASRYAPPHRQVARIDRKRRAAFMISPEARDTESSSHRTGVQASTVNAFPVVCQWGAKRERGNIAVLLITCSASDPLDNMDANQASSASPSCRLQLSLRSMCVPRDCTARRGIREDSRSPSRPSSLSTRSVCRPGGWHPERRSARNKPRALPADASGVTRARFEKVQDMHLAACGRRT